eukprot:gene23326-28226_t
MTIEELRVIYDKLDKDHNGLVSRSEVILGIRREPKIAAALNLPEHIRQEDGTRDILESFFQRLDKDDSRSISWREFASELSDSPIIDSPREETQIDSNSDSSLYESLMASIFSAAHLCGCGTRSNKMQVATTSSPAQYAEVSA